MNERIMKLIDACETDEELIELLDNGEIELSEDDLAEIAGGLPVLSDEAEAEAEAVAEAADIALDDATPDAIRPRATHRPLPSDPTERSRRIRHLRRLLEMRRDHKRFG